jgi:hypothetical protein
MEPENKNQNNDSDFGKVVEELHNKSPLPTLRTYQGDTAEFIKSKNESVISIATKERARQDQKKKELDLEFAKNPENHEARHESAKGEGVRTNLTFIALILALVGGGAWASLYIYNAFTKEPMPEVMLTNEIIPTNNILTLANSTKTNFGSEIKTLSYTNGINLVKVSDANGALIQKSRDFFNFLAIAPPPTLERTLKDYYFLGAFSEETTDSLFVILTVNDYGIAFSSMLTWEEKIEKDFGFFNSATSTDTYTWKDVIVKNKDTRALINPRGNAKIAYTFLDKNTILIVNNLPSIGTLSSLYASRAVAR